MKVIRVSFALLGALAFSSALLAQESPPVVTSSDAITGHRNADNEETASSEDSPVSDVKDVGITLHLVPLRSGFFASTFGHDLDKMRSTATFKTAAQFGVNPIEDLSGYVISRHRRRSWFYMFHNVVRCDPECPYFVQRIHKRISDYRSIEGDPDVTDHYLVEALKNHSGQNKRPDQHYGSYSLRRYKRRVIEKRIEIGELVNAESEREPAAWPYEASSLGVTLQGYQASRHKYDEVKFKRSVTWTIRVGFDITGRFSLQVPELGIDVLRQVSLLPPVALELDQFPDRITLTPGKGLNFLPLGVTEDRVLRVAGIPIRVSTTGKNRYLYYDPGLVLMFRNSGALSVIYARDEFAGKTDKGILLGDDKQAVVQAYGEPVQQADDFQRFDGLRVEYDDKGKVKTLSVFPKKKKKEPGREHPASMAME